MGDRYQHLSFAERALIQAKLGEGCNVRQIASSLHRAASTITWQPDGQTATRWRGQCRWQRR